MNNQGKKQYLYESPWEKRTISLWIFDSKKQFWHRQSKQNSKNNTKVIKKHNEEANYHLGNCLIDENPKTNLKGKHIHKTGITHIKKFTQQSLYNNQDRIIHISKANLQDCKNIIWKGQKGKGKGNKLTEEALYLLEMGSEKRLNIWSVKLISLRFYRLHLICWSI